MALDATAIAVPAKLEEIFGFTFAKPLIPPAAMATPKSSKVGRERLIISLPNCGSATKDPITKAKTTDRIVPIMIAAKTLRNKTILPSKAPNRHPSNWQH